MELYFQDLLAVGMIVPLVANHVRALGGNHIYVGLLGSIYSIFQLASGPLIVSCIKYHNFCPTDLLF